MNHHRARYHIVVIDDSDDILLLLRTMLEAPTWSMTECSDATNALQCVHNAQPDVILLDLRLGAALSGWDILQELKAESRTAGVPVILFTADTRALQGKEEWLNDLDVRVLTKPFELDDLYAALEEAVQNSNVGVQR